MEKIDEINIAGFTADVKLCTCVLPCFGIGLGERKSHAVERMHRHTVQTITGDLSERGAWNITAHNRLFRPYDVEMDAHDSQDRGL